MLKPVEKAPPWVIDQTPSRYLTVYLILIHSGLLLSLPVYGLPAELKFFAALAILLHGGFSHWRWNTVRCSRWITQCGGSQEGFWIVDRQGRRAVMLQEATVWRWLIVLNLSGKDNGTRYSLVLFPDSCNTEQRRRMRVFLRHCVIPDVKLKNI